MAYNLQSLITILEQILNPDQTHWILDHNKPQLESLLEKAASLQQILEKTSLAKVESLESQIRDAAHEAEDLIESHMVDQMLSNPEGVSLNFFTPDFQQVMHKLDMVMDEAVKLLERKAVPTSSSSSGASFSSHGSGVVGVDADLMALKGRLAGMESELVIIPIVGMGGIGKTTLARKLYEDPFVVEHFDTLAWSTISQDYNMKAILACLLRCIIGKEEFDYQHSEKKNDELKHILYQSLYDKRYMIVLDDIWNTDFWDDIWKILPDNNNGSRIVITTRESGVARYTSSQSPQHQVQLLSKSESWNLLRQIVFGEDDCPSALQGLGETIASNCGGLPLAINVIGGILSNLEKSREVWEDISTDVSATIAESDDQFLNILSLSYNHLSNQLKPCFLYMAAFPEDYEVRTSTLIHLWVAEGFVKANKEKSLEEVAEDYIKSLAERNLLSVKEKTFDARPVTCNIHDLLRDLCIRKANEEKFLHVVKNRRDVPFSRVRRLSKHTYYVMEDVCASVESIPLVRSFLCHIGESWEDETHHGPFFSQSKLVKVLDLSDTECDDFPSEILQLFNLRYLAISHHEIPGAISRLRNLQTLNVNVGSNFRGSFFDLSSEIWEMSELRHLICTRTIKFEDDYIIKVVHKKLQTISTVDVTHSLIKRGFFESIPNIKELGITYHGELPSNEVDLSHHDKLETITCTCEVNGKARYFLHAFRFPSSLKNVTLNGLILFSSDLMALCALPKLEALTLSVVYFESEEKTYEEWKVPEGDVFHSLQFLYLEPEFVERWIADETNFPKLRHLTLVKCYLKEIPEGIGLIPTLEVIELVKCSESVVASAKKIQEEQQSDYEIYIQLRISDKYRYI